MKHFHFNAAALGLAVGLVLAGQQASASVNLVTNGDFTDGLLGWTVVGNEGRPANVLFVAAVPYGANGIPAYLAMACGASLCPNAGPSNSISQQLNALITGHEYELTFYATGYGGSSSQLAPPSFGVTLGGGTTDLFLGTPVNGDPFSSWVKKTLDFSFDGNSTSRLLSFIQEDPTVGCLPCTLFLGNVVLNDITTVSPPPPPPPPPPPQVAEPSSLLTAALGLGLLGLYFRRRHHHGDVA